MKPLLSLVRRLLDPRVRVPAAQPPAQGGGGTSPAGKVRPPLWRTVLGNPPLLIGTLILLFLFVIVLFGPALAPQNPYLSGQPISRHYDAERGILVDPPLPPSAEFPFGTDRWGMDLLSLLLHGARNTLVACVFIASVRVLLGLLLGGLAGWNEGRWVDQVTMGAVGVVTAVPALISSMFLIYALDIRRGLLTFLIALSIVGWTEIAQYIRGEFLVLRKMPFIEGARASGMGAFSIAVRQVIPNLLPHLLVLSFLEMGAVMMLLGELGFIGVYIGGSSRIGIEVELFTQQIFQLVETPEWGAMLAEGFRFLRTRPFVVFPPAAAFFLAVVGFNTFGDGLRRHIEVYGLNTGALLRKRSLLVFAVITAATIYVINRTGPAPWFEKVAHAYDGTRAYDQALQLAEFEGRGHGQQGGEQAVEFILDAVREYGLTPGWKENSYVYTLPASLIRPLAEPELELLGPDESFRQRFVHQDDFAYVTTGHGGSGEASGGLTFIGFLSRQAPDPTQYAGLDLRGRLVLLQEGNAPDDFATEAQIRGAQGILWITPGEETPLWSQAIRMKQDPPGLLKPQIPIFRIRPSTARAILATEDLELADLYQLDAAADGNPGIWLRRDLRAQVRMSLKLPPPETYDVRNVLAYLPGSDFDHADEMIVLFASYDGLGVDPDETVFPAANDDGSGVAALLELAHLWQQQGLQPRRPVLFVFWGTGTLEDAGARDFLRERFNFRHLLTANEQQKAEPKVVFQLEGIGAGSDPLFMESPGNRFADVLEETARELGLKLVRETTSGNSLRTTAGTSVPWIKVHWTGSEIPPRADQPERLDKNRFDRVGELMGLTLAKILRQTEY
ncbi:MAG: ABC transporter permease subunit [Anaerolineales bacterium]